MHDDSLSPIPVIEDPRVERLEEVVRQLVRQVGQVTKDGEPFAPQEVAAADALLPILVLEADHVAREAGLGGIGVYVASNWDAMCGISLQRAPDAPTGLVLLLVLQALVAERDDLVLLGQISPGATDIPIDRIVTRWMSAIDLSDYNKIMAA